MKTPTPCLVVAVADNGILQRSLRVVKPEVRSLQFHLRYQLALETSVTFRTVALQTPFKERNLGGLPPSQTNAVKLGPLAAEFFIAITLQQTTFFLVIIDIHIYY